MNTEKNNLRARAALLFVAEERCQDLVGRALLQGDCGVVEVTGQPNQANKLDALALGSDQGILAVHSHLQQARSRAAYLQAKDGQLAALNQLIYGDDESRGVNTDIIEGEIIGEPPGT